MKKKLLFVIPGLDAGGAEKSLVNLLNTIDKEKYDVDLFLFSHQGLFLDQVPNFVHILPKNPELITFQKSILPSLLGLILHGNFCLAKDRFLYFWKNRNIKNAGIAEQFSWENFRNAFRHLETKYDIAIGFLEKSSIYFTVDKIHAVKKIGFIHTFFSALDLDMNFEKKYIKSLDCLAAVSIECADDLKSIFPEVAEKIEVMPNIVSSQLINKLASENIEKLKTNSIISVGRLIPLKGFDLAIEAGEILKNRNIPFHWYIIGEGLERPNIEKKIAQYGLKDEFTLLGLRKNPYPYIRQAEIFVQPSRYEGKSIAVDEAKILGKPIVLTNFSTAKDQIQNNINGQIVAMNPEAIADGIIKFIEDKDFANRIISNLKSENFGTENEIEKFYDLL